MKMNSQLSWFSNKKQDAVSPTQIKNHVSNLHTWMRNLEQNVTSVSARLGAVENRLTHFSKMKNQSGKDASRAINNNLSDTIIIDEHTMDQIQGIGNELQHITQSITQLKQQTDAFHEFQEQAKEELLNLRQLKKKQPIMMKLGHREIPVELTGIIGGSIAFIISALLFVDAADVVLSPWFIFGIGSVLMGSTFFRTNSGISIIKKIHATLFSQGKNANANHSDSLS